MPSSSTPTVLEAFLLIEQPRQRLGHWSNALAALDSPFAPTKLAVVAYYDPSSDQALLDLQYDAELLDESGLQYVMNVALLAEVGMVQPAALSEPERVRFLSSRLSRCTLRVTSQRTAVGALAELVRLIKGERTTHAKPPPIPARTVAPRGDSADPPIAITAKGTRDNLEKLRDSTPSMSKRDEAVRVDRYSTAKMPPEVRQRLNETARSDEHGTSTAPMGMAALQGLSAETKQPDIIYARYLRGGRWIAVRVGALSLKGAALLTGALPRTRDRVEIALMFGEHRALVRGLVAKVSTARESSATGAATFSVAFQLDESARKQLTALLLAARDAKVTIKPPPPRSTRRFPVEWQLALGTTKGAVKAIALDVSTGGMFVRPHVALTVDAAVTFSVLLDDGSSPISGRARVVRFISEAEATACGLVFGYGLEIVEMAEADRMRWLGFLARIERRAEKRVIIGADATRLAELQAGLASLGYAVVGGTDPGALVQLANEARPADAVLIDSGWLQNEASTALVEKLMASRNLPCVTMNGEVRRARQAIDKLLEVVV